MNKAKSSIVAAALTAAVLMSPVAKADGEGFYAEIGGSIALPSEFDATFGETASEWEPGSASGAKLQLGWDFGEIRVDARARAYASSIDSVSGTTGATRDDFWFGIGTFNAYYDFTPISVSDGVSLTPFAGAGIGAAGGYARATATQNGQSRRDNRDDYGLAGSLFLGGMLNMTESIGLTAEYEMTYADIGGGFTNHAASLGLRFTF